MPQKRDKAGGPAADSTQNRTVFPSLSKWETPEERTPSLASLRAKKNLLQLPVVLEDPRHTDVKLTVDQDQVAALVSQLSLDSVAAERLQSDTALIAGWYYLPGRRARLRLDHASHLGDFTQAAKHAARLAESLSDAHAIQESIRDLSEDEPETFREIDVHRLLGDLTHLTRAADRLVNQAKPGRGGRKSDYRRNVAVALITEAVEEAVGVPVKITRGMVSGQPRFTNPPGRYLCGIMKLLGWTDEDVLVAAFEKVRRKPRVKQST